MSTPRKPDLDHLINALTADGSPGELAGRDAAVDAFRAARERDAAGGARRRRPRGEPVHWPPTSAARRLAATGAALVVAAGVAASAYTQALPGPVQQLAHTVFAPLGVPGNQRSGQPEPGEVPGTGSTGITIATSGGGSRPATPSGAARTPSARPEGGYLITVGVSRTRVPAGGRVAFAGRVTGRGLAAAGVRVRLLERLAGSAQFELVATGVTGPLGGYRLLSPPLTATAVFRVVAGPGSAHSAGVRVTVVRAKVTARAADAAQVPPTTGG